MRFTIICLVLCSSLIANAQPLKEHGALSVVGKQLTGKNGKPVVLRGMSFGWHNFWPRFYNAEAVEWLAKDWKSTVVRAAMGIEPARGYLKNKDSSVRLVRAVVEAAIENDIYVIIDWHSHNINLEEAKEFFALMAKDYGHHPHVIYEIFNEPDQESWAEVKKYSEELISVIRAIDPDNIILVGSPHWDQDVHIVADDPLVGQTNIMYTLHYYAATHKEGLRKKADYALSKGIPLFISESAGMEATGDGPLDEKEWKRWIKWSEKNQISWITWSVSDKDETCSVLKKSAASGGGWKKDDLKKSGILTRKYLRKLNKE